MAKKATSRGARFLTVGFTQAERDSIERQRKEIYPSEQEREYLEAQLARQRAAKFSKYNAIRKRYGTAYGERIGRGVNRVLSLRNARNTRMASGFIGALGGSFSQGQPQTSQGYGGRGRPQGTVKYSIPGVGPVGVYEYRRWLRHKFAMERLQQRQQVYANIQQYKEYNNRQLAQAVPQEQRTIPNTGGFVPMGSVHKEADDAANIVP